MDVRITKYYFSQDLSLSTYLLTISLLCQKIFHLKVSVSEIVFFGMHLRYTNPSYLSIVFENYFAKTNYSECNVNFSKLSSILDAVMSCIFYRIISDPL